MFSLFDEEQGLIFLIGATCTSLSMSEGEFSDSYSVDLWRDQDYETLFSGNEREARDFLAALHKALRAGTGGATIRELSGLERVAQAA